MIYKLTITDPKHTPVPHWPKVKFLKTVDVIEFKPGLNIIYGGNGTGKSTLLSALAILTHSWQTNWPRVTKDSISLFNRPNGLADGMLLSHDGQPVRYLGVEEPSFAPERAVKIKRLSTLKVPVAARSSSGS